MKKICVLFMFGLCAGLLSAAELKVAVVDVQRVVENYYKTKEVSELLKAKDAAWTKNYRGLQYDGQKLVEDVKALRQLCEDKTLSYKERETKKKEFELKSSELDLFDKKVQVWKAQSTQELIDFSHRLNLQLKEDVAKATLELGQKEGYHLLLNANKADPLASDVLFAKGVEDVTEKVLTKLNASRPVKTDAPK